MIPEHPQGLSRHRYTGAAPESRPLWGDDQSETLNSLLIALWPLLGTDGGSISQFWIQPDDEDLTVVCGALTPPHWQTSDPQAVKRYDLCLRLILHLVQPANYRMLCNGEPFRINVRHWKPKNLTAHEQIESQHVLNTALKQAGPEARWIHKTLLASANKHYATA